MIEYINNKNTLVSNYYQIMFFTISLLLKPNMLKNKIINKTINTGWTTVDTRILKHYFVDVMSLLNISSILHHGFKYHSYLYNQTSLLLYLIIT